MVCDYNCVTCRHGKVLTGVLTGRIQGVRCALDNSIALNVTAMTVPCMEWKNRTKKVDFFKRLWETFCRPNQVNKRTRRHTRHGIRKGGTYCKHFGGKNEQETILDADRGDHYSPCRTGSG